MKTLFKITSVAVLTAMMAAIGFAQDQPTLATLYTQFRAELKGKTCGNRDSAVPIGQKILELYKDDKDNVEVIKYVTDKLAEIAAKDPACKRQNRYNALGQFNVNGKELPKTWGDMISAGKEVINVDGASNPGLALDVMLDIVSIAYDRSSTNEKNDAYLGDMVAYAKTGLQKLSNPSTVSSTGKWGGWLPFGTREDATSWLNYMLAYNAGKTGNKNEKLMYLYKASLAGEKSKDPTVFKTIGDFYFDNVTNMFEDYKAKLKALPAGTEETQELKDQLALARGNAERAMDAYARAYKLIPADKTAAKQAFLKDITTMYRFRNKMPEPEKLPDLEPVITAQVMKPFPDPSSAVTPVVIEDKPVAATTPSTTPTTTPAATTTPAKTTMPATTPAKTTTPATTTPAKTTTTAPKTTTPAAKPSGSTSTTKATKPAATAKTAAKKKGTR